jgi:hypothetical protein
MGAASKAMEIKMQPARMEQKRLIKEMLRIKR